MSYIKKPLPNWKGLFNYLRKYTISYASKGTIET